MVLIAIDKHSRKILGYLCKNNQTVTYCCSDCDVEYATASALEEHMVTHEQKSAAIERIPQIDDGKPADLNGDEIPLLRLSRIEHENLLKTKYQVTPCSVKLIRDSSIDLYKHLANTRPEIPTFDKENMIYEAQDTNELPSRTMKARMESTEMSFELVDDDESQSSLALDPLAQCTSDDQPLQRMKRKRLPKKQTDLLPMDESISAKRRRTPTQKNMPPKKKPLKTKPRPQISICFLCGAQFSSSIQLTQHQKTHFASTISHSPVFPCNVCGRQVKNLKMHLRQHKTESKQQQQQSTANGKAIKSGQRSKSIEAPKLNGSKKSDCVTKRARAKSTESTAVARSSAVVKSSAAVSSHSLVKRAEASSSTDAVFSKIPCDIMETELFSSNEALINSNDSNTSSTSSFNLIRKCVAETNAILLSNDISLPPFSMSSEQPSFIVAAAAATAATATAAVIEPFNIIDEDPLQIPTMTSLEPISVNEPSQSTSVPQPFDCIGEQNFQRNDMNERGETKSESEIQKSNDKQYAALYKCPKCSRHFESPERVAKHCKKHAKKVNCKFCGKLLAKSYIKVHIINKHQTKSGNTPLNAGNGEET